jgi:PAS domain S-box-containing protein
VLSVDKVRSGDDTLESDMRLLTIIAAVVAQAVRVHGAIAEIVTLKERTERILAGMPDGILVLDPTGVMRAVNPAAERIFGFRREDVSGRHYIHVFADHRSVLNILERIYDDPNAAASFEAHIFGSGAEPMPVAITWSILGDDSAGDQSLVVNVQDLTHVKRLERQWRRSQRLAALGTMATGVAHEIRNPLGGIRGSSQLLAREMGKNRKVKDFLDVIMREVDRLDHTVEQLLGFARPTKAGMAPTGVEDIIERALAVLKPEIEKNGIRVVKNVPSEVRRIHADASQLTQVFLNLFLNALQAMPDGGVLTISVREDTGLVQTDSPFVVVEINDTGHGMSSRVLEHLFMPFFTTRESGTGLGLAISHRIVEEHSGSIDVVSEEGKGTTCIVSFSAAGRAARKEG